MDDVHEKFEEIAQRTAEEERADAEARNLADAKQPRYKALIQLAGEQEKGVVIELSTGRQLRGSVYAHDAHADWVRLFTHDSGAPYGPTWINQDQIVAMWWAPERLPFDIEREIDSHEDEDED